MSRILSRISDFISQNVPDSLQVEVVSLIERLCGYEQFEYSINYHFSDKSLLLQAMTHGSSSSNKLTEDNQTLEFLGDFVLNFLISRHLEKQSGDNSITQGDL